MMDELLHCDAEKCAAATGALVDWINSEAIRNGWTDIEMLVACYTVAIGLSQHYEFFDEETFIAWCRRAYRKDAGPVLTLVPNQ